MILQDRRRMLFDIEEEEDIEDENRTVSFEWDEDESSEEDLGDVFD